MVDALSGGVAGLEEEAQRGAVDVEPCGGGGHGDVLAADLVVAVGVLGLQGGAEAAKVEVGGGQKGLLQLKDEAGVVAVVECFSSPSAAASVGTALAAGSAEDMRWTVSVYSTKSEIKGGYFCRYTLHKISRACK